MAKTVRDTMIDVAWLLIAEKGLHGLSVHEVLERAGAPRGSVYHHFPGGRAELIDAAIERSRVWMQDEIAQLNPNDAAGVVTGYLGIWRGVLENTDFKAGCAIAGLVSGATYPDQLDVGAAAYAETQTALAAKFEAAGLSRNLSDGRAALLVSAAEGAVLLAKAQRRIDPLTAVCEELARAWD